MKAINITLIIILFISSTLTLASSCESWSNPEKIGSLKIDDDLSEQSGFDTSNVLLNRMYHVSDAKKKLNLYISELNGKDDQKTRTIIKGTEQRVKAVDVEDITVGSCFGITDYEQCIYLMDIGGAKSKVRSRINLTIVPEKKYYGRTTNSIRSIVFAYPNGEAYDAEGASIHPITGDIFIFTKNLDNKNKTSGPSKVFKLKKEDWQHKINGYIPEMEYVGTIDMSKFIRPNIKKKKYMHLPITGMDIAQDGESFVVSTYRDLFKFNIDLSNANATDLASLRIGNTVKRFELNGVNKLIQQEAITVDSSNTGSETIYYTTEYGNGNKPEGASIEQPIMKIECLD